MISPAVRCFIEQSNQFLPNRSSNNSNFDFFRFGGGPFIVAYMIVLLLIGLPMMTLELTLGQKFQGGDVDAFGSINPRFRYRDY